VIRSYGDRKTEAFARGEVVRDFKAVSAQATRRLMILNAATSLNDLRVIGGNRLKSLKGDRAGQYSILINRQWRICFKWPNDTAGPEDIEIVDYH